MKLEIIAITQCNKIKLIKIDKKRSCFFRAWIKVSRFATTWHNDCKYAYRILK
ncbi:hypothetical protein [Helicobacter bilis]|uniref:hypothetical protein n=1 Tax=Helicobacter bilis TaxID=37372 RepID=UPI0012BA7014|nr:hypothetical protein [Helicobacter bilis]